MALFTDFTEQAGLVFNGRTHGAAVGDFNGDGLPDIFVGNHEGAVGNSPPDNLPILYLNQGDGTFIDVADTVLFPNVPARDFHSQGWIDFDNDGDQDLIIPEHGRRFPDRIYVNNGVELIDQGAERGFATPNTVSSSQSFFDFNRDGRVDIFVNAAPNSSRFSTVFQQNRQGGFDDVGSRVLPEDIKINHSVVTDLSGDGIPELLLGGLRKIYDTSTETFTDVTSQWVDQIAGAEDVAVGDFNGDLRPDVFLLRNGYGFTDVNQLGNRELEINLAGVPNDHVAIRFQNEGKLSFNILQQPIINQLDDIYIGSSGFNPDSLDFELDSADPRFHGVPEYRPGIDSGFYIGFDTDTREWTIAKSNLVLPEFPANITAQDSNIRNLSTIGFNPDSQGSRARLFLNTGSELSNESESTGISDIPIFGRGVTAGDFDGDMDLDLYIVTNKGIRNIPNILLENDGNGNFTPVEDGAGAPGPGINRGIGDTAVSADFNSDGFLDLFVTNGFRPREFNDDGPHQLYLNNGNENNWLFIDLIGTKSTRDGIGSKVYVTAGGVTQLREQNGGIHYKAQDHQRLHFGLGSNEEIDSIEVKWLSGTQQFLRDFDVNQILSIQEGRGGRGNDRIIGTHWNDRLNGQAGNDRLVGKGGNDRLIGKSGQDVLVGNAGNDILIGNTGQDTMTGGAGQDRFVYNWLAERGDEIRDFAIGQDKLEFNAQNFSFTDALVPGLLADQYFVLGTSANDANDRFIYDSNTGNLFFDRDGSGDRNQLLVAQLSNRANLSASDIRLV